MLAEEFPLSFVNTKFTFVILFITPGFIPKCHFTGAIRHMGPYLFISKPMYNQGFLGSLVSKESPRNTGDQGLIPGSGRSTGEGNGNPLRYFCLENSMDRAAWEASSSLPGSLVVHGVTKSWTQLSNFAFFIQSAADRTVIFQSAADRMVMCCFLVWVLIA